MTEHDIETPLTCYIGEAYSVEEDAETLELFIECLLAALPGCMPESPPLPPAGGVP